MRPPTIWFISEVFFPDEVATSHYLSNIAFHLARRFTVKALTIRDGSAPAREQSHGVEIFRSRVPHFDKNRVASRILKALISSAGILLQVLIRVRRGDTVFVVTNPPILPVVTIPLSKLKGARVVLRVDDIYPDSLAAGGVLSKKSITFRMLLELNRISYRFADRIITLGRDMAMVIGGRMKKGREKISIISNWADCQEIRPLPSSENHFWKEIPGAPAFTVLIAGNIGRVQGIPTLLEAAKRLRNEQNLKLLFIGDGALRTYLEREVTENSLTNVVWMPNQPRRRQNEFLNACDVALLTLSPNMYGIGVPSRLYNYLAAGRPVIGIVEKDSEPGLTISECGLGWVATPGDAGSVANAILEAKASTNLVEIGRRAREVAEKSFSIGAILGRYHDFFEDFQNAGKKGSVSVVLTELKQWSFYFLSQTPGKTGRLLRFLYLRAFAKSVGKNVWLETGVDIQGVENISFGSHIRIGRNSSLYAIDGSLRIGNHCSINFNTSLDASNNGKIVLGDHVLIAQNVVVRASNHCTKDMSRPISEQGHVGNDIQIGNDVWIGANTVLTPGVSIGDHSVVSAGALVTSSLPDRFISSGLPAKPIFQRGLEESAEDITAH